MVHIDLDAYRLHLGKDLDQGDLHLVKEVFEAFLQRRPDNAAAYVHLADVYKIQERYDRALEAYSQALTFDESRADAWFSRAVIQLTKIEDPDRGMTALTEALDAGFNDQESISDLLSDSNLLERDKVESLLQQRGLLPEKIEEKE